MHQMPEYDAAGTRFHTQGPLPPDAAALYVTRPADDTLTFLIDRREYISLIGPRLSGKSTMLLRQWARLRRSPRYLPVYVSLGQLQALPEPDWHAYLHRQIAQQTDGRLPDPDAPAVHPLDLQEHLIDAMQGPLQGYVLVILLDQIESTPTPFASGFFAVLREMLVNRWMRQPLQNIVFVLAGRFIPDSLIEDATISPFRVTETVYVEDADFTGVMPLVAHLETPDRQLAPDVPARIYEWTEGDVYLTHKLCAALDHEIPEGTILLADVDRAVRRHLFEAPVLRRIWDQLQADPDTADLLTTLLEHHEPIRFTLLQRHIMTAWLAGAVRADASGLCVLRSLVHESVFYTLHQAGNGRTSGTSAPGVEPSGSANQHLLRERYQIQGVLNPGMTSYVYRALDTHTGQPVAVKQLMVTRHLNEVAWHRFQREAEALKQLDHPHIVRLLDSFHDGAFEYIVMDYIYGGSLFDRLNREGRLGIRLAVEIAHKLAGALAYAHAHGVIHRDVKPSNTMLTPDYNPLLADFGVARLTYETRLTQPYTVIGTIPYLSPEALAGQSDACDDVWALGVMLYEMLAGTLPFVGRTDDLTIHAILNHDPADLHRIRPDVPAALTDLIAAMLEKHPPSRLSDAADVHAVLGDILATLPD